jgi:anthranilate/para-aminobenzoate synthase component II
VIAETAEGEVMAIAHLKLPIVGVQFHPESILTEHGHQLMKNWLTFAHKFTF